ncbi:hypothetical protein KY284_009834 [Solanum tuberosum]|nr:hypothetical protein KY284_009834 [Solanum tuberosum]
MIELTTDLVNAKKNERVAVDDEELECLSSGHKTSDYNDSQATELQSLHESPHLNEKLKRYSYDYSNEVEE